MDMPARPAVIVNSATVTAADIVTAFQHDTAALIVGVALCTIAAGLLLLAAVGGLAENSEFVLTGLFALAYGTRLILNTHSAAMLLESPPWLPYLRAQLEYLVPLPGAVLFARYGGRFRRLNQILIGVLAAFPAGAIPYELATARPFAAKSLMDSLVVVMMVVFALNLYAPPANALRRVGLVRAGSIVLLLFVINEHVRLIRPTGLTSEPVGFLFFIFTIVVATMFDSVRGQRRLVEIDSELSTARRIQLSILPRRNPELAGLEIATVYTPASDVAGDFYEFLDLGDSRLGVFIADVSGHGVPAALVASMLKVAVASQNAHATAPAVLLRELNLLFCGKLDRQFITAAYAFIDLSAGEVTIASAGHPAPLLRRHGAAEEVVARGAILGRFREAGYEQVSLPFHSGDALLLYTDGLTEARRADDEIWGEARLQALVGTADVTAAELASRVVAEAARWAGSNGPPGDDITLIALRRTGGFRSIGLPTVPSP